MSLIERRRYFVLKKAGPNADNSYIGCFPAALNMIVHKKAEPFRRAVSILRCILASSGRSPTAEHRLRIAPRPLHCSRFIR